MSDVMNPSFHTTHKLNQQQQPQLLHLYHDDSSSNSSDKNMRDPVADYNIEYSRKHKLTSGKRRSDTMINTIRQFPQLNLKTSTVKTWETKKNYQGHIVTNTLTDKQKRKIENRRTSRCKLTEKESYVNKKFLKKALYDVNFPTKSELLTIVRKLVGLQRGNAIEWDYLRKWMHRNDF